MGNKNIGRTFEVMDRENFQGGYTKNVDSATILKFLTSLELLEKPIGGGGGGGVKTRFCEL